MPAQSLPSRSKRTDSAPWKSLVVRCPTHLRDEVEGVLFLLGCQGTQEIEAVIRESTTTIKAFFPPTSETGPIRILLDKSYSCRSTEEPIPDQDWEQEWRKNITPVQIAPHFWVRPSWVDFVAPDGHKVLIIDPKMTFGSGHHETTRLAATWTEEVGGNSKRVLDVGCGTGILALVAANMGGENVIAFDIDPMIADNGAENLRQNTRGNRVRAFVGPIESLRTLPRFDLIIANMIRQEIFPLLDAFCSRMQPQGKLILSGLLQSEANLTYERLKSTPLEILGEKTEGEWMGICCRKMR